MHTLTPLQIGGILECLRECGVSPFNVIIHSTGAVAFCSNGLSAEEVRRARMQVAVRLMEIAGAK